MFEQLPEFLFLNPEKIAEYIDWLEGSVPEKFSWKQSQKKRFGGKLKVPVAEVDGSGEKLDETTQVSSVKSSGLFQHLFLLLEKGNKVQYLDAFDETIWNDLRRKEFLEIKAVAKISEVFKKSQAAEDISPVLKTLKTVSIAGGNQDAGTAISGIEALLGLVKQKHVPLIFHAESTPDFQFVAKLPIECLRCDELPDLEEKVTVFGNVKKKAEKGKVLAKFSLVPELTSAMSQLDGNKRAKAESEMIKKGSLEVVKGPGIELIPLAVYVD